MEIESAHAHDVYDGHSTQGMQAIGGRSAGKIEMGLIATRRWSGNALVIWRRSSAPDWHFP